MGGGRGCKTSWGVGHNCIFFALHPCPFSPRKGRERPFFPSTSGGISKKDSRPFSGQIRAVFRKTKKTPIANSRNRHQNTCEAAQKSRPSPAHLGGRWHSRMASALGRCLHPWRRVRDLNPSYAFNVNTISSRAPSTTQPTLHGRSAASSATTDIISVLLESVKQFLHMF